MILFGSGCAIEARIVSETGRKTLVSSLSSDEGERFMASKKATKKGAASKKATKGATKKTTKKTSKKPAGGATGTIMVWEDDPGAAPGLNPVPRPAPALGKLRLRIQISDPAPPAKPFPVATREFRYWAAAEALGRSAEFWGGIVPDPLPWQVGGF